MKKAFMLKNEKEQNGGKPKPTNSYGGPRTWKPPGKTGGGEKERAKVGEKGIKPKKNAVPRGGKTRW